MLYSADMNNPYFRPGAGSVIYDKAGKIIVFERADLPNVWQLQQGGLESNETPTDALWRELREETGFDRIHFASCIEYPDWTLYTYSDEARAKIPANCLGQAHRWFFLELHSHAIPDLSMATDDEFTNWKWSNFQDILNTTNPMKLPVYTKLAHFFDIHIKPSLSNL